MMRLSACDGASLYKIDLRIFLGGDFFILFYTCSGTLLAVFDRMIRQPACNGYFLIKLF